MKILYFVYHGFSDVSGITKKVRGQVEGLRQLGHEVHVCSYGFDSRGHRVRFVDSQPLEDFGHGIIAALRSRICFSRVVDYVRNLADYSGEQTLVYARSFNNADPFTVSLFRRLRRMGVRSVIEIPTYPYDREYVGLPLAMRLKLRIDRLFRHSLAMATDAIVTFSDEKRIFGQRTLRISNGVDLDSLPLKRPSPPPCDATAVFHVIAVAEVHYWHGFDRFIAGMGEYYAHGGQRNIVFHIVGGVAKSEMYDSCHAPGFAGLIARYDLLERVIFHGALYGKALDDVFDSCQFAVASLARHRSGISRLKALKNCEYAARGIPFIYSEQNSDFDSQPYIIKAPPDESPIDIERVLEFYDHLTMTPADIRATVEHLSWKEQMRKVVEQVCPSVSSTGKLKIAYCIPSMYIAGGMERVLALKANYFTERLGYDVTIIMTDGEGRKPFYELSPKVRLICLGIEFESLWNQPLWRKVLIYLKKERQYKRRLSRCLMTLRPDITVSMLRREINFLNDIPDGSIKIGEIHINRNNFRDLEGNIFKRLISRLWMRQLVGQLKRLDLFVCLTGEDRAHWKELSRVEVIPDPLSFRPARLSSGTEKNVIAVGRYAAEKGYDLLLEAWRSVAAAHPDWRLNIYGSGERDYYQSIVDRYQLGDSCRLHPPTSDIGARYAESSLFVLSSRFEGFGMVILEAMACGVPPVSFSCPWGPQSIISDGVDGLLARNGDTADLAAKINFLIEHDDVRRRLSAAAPLKAEKYNIDIIGEQWRKVFESLMAKKN